MDRGEARVAETARLAWARSSSQLEARCSDRARRAWRRLTAYKRVQELVEQDDWVCVWIGLAGFAVLCANAALYRAPMVWDGRSMDLLRGLQTFVLLLVLPMVGLGWRSLGGWPKIQRLLPAFAILSALALLGSTLGKQVESRAIEPSHTPAACTAHSEQTRANERGAPMPHQPALLQVGLGASVWTLVLGMLVSNGLGRVTSISVLEPGAKRAEFFIKIGLVLLGVELSSLGSYGAAGLVVAWGVTPVCVAVIYWAGVRHLAPQSPRSLIVLLAAGISVHFFISASLSHPRIHPVSVLLGVCACLSCFRGHAWNRFVAGSAIIVTGCRSRSPAGRTVSPSSGA